VFSLARGLAGRGQSVRVVHCLDACRLRSRKAPAPAPPGHPGVQVHTLRSGGPISPLVLSKPAGVILDRPRFGVYSN